jgi:hypothetical protein
MEDDDTRQLYVDGVLQLNMTGDFGQAGDASIHSLYLGGRSFQDGNVELGHFFNGLLYDVRIYAMPLDANVIQRIKDIGKNNKPTMIRYY